MEMGQAEDDMERFLMSCLLLTKTQFYVKAHTEQYADLAPFPDKKRSAYHLTAYTERAHRRLPHAITSSNSRLAVCTERAQRLGQTQYFSSFCFCPVLCGIILCSQNRSYGRFENQAYGRSLAMLVLACSHIVKFIYYIDCFISSSFLCGRCFLHHWFLYVVLTIINLLVLVF